MTIARRFWHDGLVPLFRGPHALPWTTYGRLWPAAVTDWWRRTARRGDR